MVISTFRGAEGGVGTAIPGPSKCYGNTRPALKHYVSNTLEVAMPMPDAFSFSSKAMGAGCVSE